MKAKRGLELEKCTEEGRIYVKNIEIKMVRNIEEGIVLGFGNKDLDFTIIFMMYRFSTNWYIFPIRLLHREKRLVGKRAPMSKTFNCLRF